MRPIGTAALVLALAATGSGRAEASNSKPRTPPTLGSSPCLVEVDRSVDPVLTLAYGLPLEDPQADPPLLPDNRTHQFFLACRDVLPDETPPSWIDEDDVARADMVGVLDMAPDPSDVLTTAPDWQTGHDGGDGTCVFAVLDKSMRRRIVCDEAAAPITFDTQGVPPGAYVLWGYTFEPDINLWTRRLGVVWIHDGDPGAAPPAAALSAPWYEGTRVYVGDAFPVRGCAAGPSGTRVEVARAKVSEAADPQAYRLLGAFDLDVPTCDLEVPFAPAEADAGQAWILRIRAKAPDGRTFEGYAPGKLLVLSGDGTTDPGDPPMPVEVCGVTGLDAPGTAPACPAPEPPDGTTTGGSSGGPGGTGGTGSTGAGGATSGPTTGSAQDAGSGGCACQSARNSVPAPLGGMLLLAARRRRRRKVP